MKRGLLVAFVLVAMASAAGAAEIGYIEDFALATNRDDALKQLVPGTEDFYYYTCLNQQNQGQFDEVEKTLKAWIARYNRTPRVLEMENRQALLRYTTQPRQSLDFIIRRLGLLYNHQRDAQAAQRAALQTKLDPALIAPEALTRRALANNPNTVNGFEPRALEALVATNPKDLVRRNLISQLTRPDIKGLVKLISEDLKFDRSGGFGSMNIHSQLTTAQLEELLTLQPELLNNDAFVNAYLQKLQPNPDIDYAHDLEARKAHLAELWTFVQRLAPVHNSLKAHVLYHRLWLDRSQGAWNKDLFMTYLKLPRPTVYVNPKYMESRDARDYRVDLNRQYPGSLLPVVGNDEPLVRSYLAHFFLEAKDFGEYTEYVRDTYLKELFAETKITAGQGDPEALASMVSPAFFQALKERVDIEFDFTRKELYAPAEAVALDVYVKNVTDLIVKVYEINTINYYRTNNRPVDLGMDLDGLVANEEQTLKYTDPPLRRTLRHIELKSQNKRGVYIVEFIGNGKSSRALIQKGQLRFVERAGVAGQVFTILDEANKRVTDASLWLAGHEYKAEKEGTITVPFTSAPMTQPILLCQGDFATLTTFSHQPEQYQLAAGLFVDRESLLRRKSATVVIRPALFIDGRTAPIALLENVVLQIRAVDRENVATTKEIRDLKLADDQSTTYEFQVPENLKAISFTLRGQVKNLSQARKDNVADGVTFPLNGIDETDHTADLYLLQAAGQYVVEVLGKTGEVRPDSVVEFALKHKDYKELVNVSLRSDERGRIALGELKGIDFVDATDPEKGTRRWVMTPDQCAVLPVIHGKAGVAVQVPYMGKATKVDPEVFSLLETRGSTFVTDRLNALKLEDGFLIIQDLPRGDYDLLIKDTQTHITIKLAEGQASEGYVLSNYRQLQVRNPQPLQIVGMEADADSVRVQLANIGADTRVVLAATRYELTSSVYSLFDRLGLTRTLMAPTSATTQPPLSQYMVDRMIGDEFRYVLERKYAKKFPGNMLTRPTLILDPWSPTMTKTTLDVLGIGGGGNAVGGFSGMGTGRGGFFGVGAAEQQAMASATPDLDFLGQTAVVMVNLKPNDKGLVTISRKDLGAHQLIHVLAVDSQNAVCRSIAMEEVKMPFLDLRLMQAALDPAKHFTEQKQIVALGKGEAFTVRDIGSSRMETYDNLGRVYRLFTTLNPSSELKDFSFLTTWSSLKPEEKRAKFSEFACHELRFFLYKKDPAFFKEVVLPHLKNKKDKTFMDHFLLGDDLAEYLKPWAYEQLNAVEKVLLAQRIVAEQASTARHLSDTYDLIPPDVAGFNALFRTALLGSGLDTGADRSGRAYDKEMPMEELKQGLANDGAEAADMVAEGKLRVPGSLGGGGGAGGSFGAMAKATAPSNKPRSMATPAPSVAPAAPPRPSEPAAARLSIASGATLATRKSALREAASAGEAVLGDDFAYSLEEKAKDMGRRSEVRALYRPMSQTEEWAESNYYRRLIADQNASLVPVSAFWRDYAKHDGQKPFLSGNFIYAGRSLNEMLLALAVLDLPFEAAKHETVVEGATFKITAGSPMVIFDREILPAQPAAQKSPILVSQNFFRANDRYRFEGSERYDKFVTEEFLIGAVYGSQVVVTNPTSTPQKLEVLLQVPRGAMPVSNGLYTHTVSADLQPFSTQTFEYAFYFPMPGELPQYPVQVAKNGALIGFADTVTLKAVAKLSKIDTTSWDHIAQNGTPEEVVKYLKDNNADRLDLDRIAWRMQDKGFYRQVLDLLAARHIYQSTLWSYSLKHDDVASAREFLQHQDGLLQQCGPYIDSPLVTIDPVVRKSYQHLEYSPLVNARAHKLGKNRVILNDRLAPQYHELLEILSYRKTLDDDDLMAVTYYMLLQDRVEEGLAYLGRVKADKLATKMQYDYFTAYTSFYTEDLKKARAIADQYAAYPVDRWKKLFAAVGTQLDEIQGKAGAVVDDKSREQVQANLAATEPGFDLLLEAKTVKLTYQNIESFRVNYYLMDVELLFSRNPFVQQVTGQFSFVKPNQSEVVALKDKKGEYKFELPKTYHTSNVMVEIVANGVRKSQAYYANSMNVQVLENYGLLKVTNAAGKPLSKVYVKVYGQVGGQAKFYKDGYTDLRGQFDYTSVNTDNSTGVEKFAILILSDTDGAVVREANPPKR
jgi:hypothetical protein